MADTRGKSYEGTPPPVSGGTTSERRVALVIGNAAYRGSVLPLRNPTNDAKDVAAALASPKLGFKVILHLDLGRAAMLSAINAFDDEVEGAEAAVFFYAGHGAQAAGRNILLPVDFECDAALKKSLLSYEIQSKGIGLDQVLVATSKAFRTIIFLDACRDGPSRSIGDGHSSELRSLFSEGFRKIDLGDLGRHNTLVAFSTDSGQQAQDGQGNNSPYTRALLDYIEDDVSIADLLTRVRGRVLQETGNRQRPREDSTLSSVFRFPLKPSAPVLAVPPVSVFSDEALLEKAAIEHWETVKGTSDPARFREFLADYGSTRMARLAQESLQRLATSAWRKVNKRDEVAIARFIESYTDTIEIAEAKTLLAKLQQNRDASEKLQAAEKSLRWPRIAGGGAVIAVIVAAALLNLPSANILPESHDNATTNTQPNSSDGGVLDKIQKPDSIENDSDRQSTKTPVLKREPRVSLELSHWMLDPVQKCYRVLKSGEQGEEASTLPVTIGKICEGNDRKIALDCYAADNYSIATGKGGGTCDGSGGIIRPARLPSWFEPLSGPVPTATSPPTAAVRTDSKALAPAPAEAPIGGQRIAPIIEKR